MRKKITILLTSLLLTSSLNLQAQEYDSQRVNAEAATGSSYHAVAISMAFWGILLTGGITALLLTIKTSHS